VREGQIDESDRNHSLGSENGILHVELSRERMIYISTH